MELLAYPAREDLLALELNSASSKRPHFAQLRGVGFLIIQTVGLHVPFYETAQFSNMFEKYPKNRATTFLPKTGKNRPEHVKTAQNM